MKVTFCCDSGANHQSCRTETFDTVKDLGLKEGEWEAFTDDDKYAAVSDWANDKIEIFFREAA